MEPFLHDPYKFSWRSTSSKPEFCSWHSYTCIVSFFSWERGQNVCVFSWLLTSISCRHLDWRQPKLHTFCSQVTAPVSTLFTRTFALASIFQKLLCNSIVKKTTVCIIMISNHIPLKRPYTSIRLYAFTIQDRLTPMFTAVKTSNLSSIPIFQALHSLPSWHFSLSCVLKIQIGCGCFLGLRLNVM